MLNDGVYIKKTPVFDLCLKIVMTEPFYNEINW